MRVRKALPEDMPHAISLARSLDLEYPGLDGDTFWVADDGGRVVGIVALKKHPDCLELCSLGVEPAHRGKGIAAALVASLLAEAPADIHLATIIPGFFEALSFERTQDVPRSFVEKRQTAWCDGCDRRLCTVLVRKVS